MLSCMDAKEAGRRGGNARADHLSSGQRKEAAISASRIRWGEVRKRPCPRCCAPLGLGKMARLPDGQLAHAACAHEGREEHEAIRAVLRTHDV